MYAYVYHKHEEEGKALQARLQDEGYEVARFSSDVGLLMALRITKRQVDFVVVGSNGYGEEQRTYVPATVAQIIAEAHTIKNEYGHVYVVVDSRIEMALNDLFAVAA